MASSSFPRIRVSGGPEERGRQYGELAGDRVRRSAEAYCLVFSEMAGLEWPEVQEMATQYVAAIEAFEPRYIQEMAGIAEGSGLSFEEIVALNVRTEIMYSAKARAALGTRTATIPGECTCVGALPGATDTGHTLASQNWDWLLHAAETTVVLEVVQDQGPSIVTVVEAGLLGKMGFNSAGLAVLTNAIVSDLDIGTPGVPYHVCLRALLDAPNLTSALAVLQNVRRSSSANYLLLSRTGLALDIEARPGNYANLSILADERSVLIHSNHFIHRDTTWSDVGLWWMPDSPFRLLRMRQLLDAESEHVSVPLLQSAFADHVNHPLGICAHPDDSVGAIEQSATIASVIMDLDTSDLWLASGNPCGSSYQKICYADFFKAQELREFVVNG